MDRRSLEQQSFFDPGGFKPVSVGQRLREYRIERGFSIKTLAERSGLAVNTLSLIENQKTSPSVNTLEQLARALSIPLASLFEPVSEEQHLILTNPSQRREMMVDGIRVEDCGLSLVNSPVQPFIVTMPPGKDSGKHAIVHTGHEFIYCLSGVIHYHVDGKKHILHAGDSLLFEARLPHQWMNGGDSPAVYLLLMVPGDSKDVPGEVHFSTRDG